MTTPGEAREALEAAIPRLCSACKRGQEWKIIEGVVVHDRGFNFNEQACAAAMQVTALRRVKEALS